MSRNSIKIDLQNDSAIKGLPGLDDFQKWVNASLQSSYQNLEQTIRIVDEEESQLLNKTYRGKDTPTNVLSFPVENSEYLEYECLGDLVICAPVVEREARQQGKELQVHWAHMVIHGMLHLQGYDHLIEDEAHKMEALEIDILAALGHTNPYQIIERN
jgi:probable rRNA maturation factor